MFIIAAHISISPGSVITSAVDIVLLDDLKWIRTSLAFGYRLIFYGSCFRIYDAFT
jgi:hypothetical protein